MSSFTINDVNVRTEQYVPKFSHNKKNQNENELDITLSELSGANSKYVGKVRNIYKIQNKVVILATDRMSAFDRKLEPVPFKGQVLNLTSLWWFRQTQHIVPNHVIGSPHPNITIGKKCTVFPVEFVMRAYITGSTSTSIWTNYSKGVRNYCGFTLPENLKKNQKLEISLLTPTTKDDTHDELISAEEIVKSGRMTQSDWDVCANYAYKIFAFSQDKALERGLILVDTKYEFGKDEDGNILLIDEIQTPDSSRYWIAETYEERFMKNEEPDNVDKELLRRWYAANCDPYNDAVLPVAPEQLINELSRRYIMLYEVITGEVFDFESANNTDLATLKSLLD